MRRPALRCALALTLVLTWSQIAPGCAQGDDVDGVVTTTTTGSGQTGQGGGGGEGGQLFTTSGAGGGAPCDPDENCGLCGNNVLEMGEECDDGNTTPGDGCDAACNIEPSTCNPDGVWMVQGAPLAYSCCSGLVSVNVSSFLFTSGGVSISSSPTNPVPMIGSATTCPGGSFINSGAKTGGCTETYTLDGDFDMTNPDTWTGVYSVSFSGQDCDCFGGMIGTPCINQTFPVTANRQ